MRGFGLSGFGDKGYISQPLFETLYDQQVQMVTKLKARMKNRLVSFFDKLMLRKRAIIESVIDQLKNISRDASTPDIGVWQIASSTSWLG